MIFKIVPIFIVFLLIFFLNTPVFATDCTVDPGTGKVTSCPAAGVLQIQQLLIRFINLSVMLAFITTTTWLAWAAVKLFITSGGDPKSLAHAWRSFTWSLVGVFFLILAFLVLRLIYATSGVNVEQFCIGFPGAPTQCVFP